MNANELMVGDWLKHANGKYYRVTRIDVLGDYNSIHYACGFPHLWEYNNKFEPIPLTPEILEKNGFEWTTRKSYMVSCIGTVRMIWGFYKDCLSISDHSDDDGCQISSLKCKFVHQLQHALRLCGIDKTIEL